MHRRRLGGSRSFLIARRLVDNLPAPVPALPAPGQRASRTVGAEPGRASLGVRPAPSLRLRICLAISVPVLPNPRPVRSHLLDFQPKSARPPPVLPGAAPLSTLCSREEPLGLRIAPARAPSYAVHPAAPGSPLPPACSPETSDRTHRHPPMSQASRAHSKFSRRQQVSSLIAWRPLRLFVVETFCSCVPDGNYEFSSSRSLRRL